ncbi:MAG: 50S ribosomal protein L27 [Parcubacteria group bacterium]|nr:50S ribosomal protein L27 [Parcubacteria group bacterium]
MAKTKAAGSTRLGRESAAQRLGVKLFAGEIARPGSIIVRQRGTKFFPGHNTRIGSDDTIYAVKSGVVAFRDVRKRRFDGRIRHAQRVEIK